MNATFESAVRNGSQFTRMALLFFWLVLLDSGFAGDTVTNTPAKSHLGFSYTNDVVAEIPWSIHIVKVDRSHPEFTFVTTSGKGTAMGMETVSDQIKTLPPELGRPVAAINGDYFDKSPNYVGRPRNIQIRLGELVSSPSGHAAFWLDRDGKPCMTNVYSRFCITWPNGKTNVLGLNEARGEDAVVLYTSAVGASTRTSGGIEMILEPSSTNAPWLPLHACQAYSARVRSVVKSGDTPLTEDILVLSAGPTVVSKMGKLQPGDLVKFSTETTPDLSGVTMAIGGGPTLVENGKAQRWSGLIKMRHPRTAVGWNKDYIFLVEVDGRQSDVSLGMTFPELADYMAKIGCEQAMNLDGGGSSTLWLLGNVMSSPSEGRERPAPSALVVVRKAPK